MAYKKFFVELDFDLDEFDPEKLTLDYVLGVVERKLCSRGVEAKIHTDNPYAKVETKAMRMKLKAVILNNSVGKGRVIHIGCERAQESEIIKRLRNAGLEADVRKPNY